MKRGPESAAGPHMLQGERRMRSGSFRGTGECVSTRSGKEPGVRRDSPRFPVAGLWVSCTVADLRFRLCCTGRFRGRGFRGLSPSAGTGSHHTLPAYPATLERGRAHRKSHIRHIVNASGSGCQNEAGPNLGPHALHLSDRLPTVGEGPVWQPGKSCTFRLPRIHGTTLRYRRTREAFRRLAGTRFRALTAAMRTFARAQRGRVRRDQGIRILREQVEGRHKLVLVEQRHHAPPRMPAATPCRPGTHRTRRPLRPAGKTDRLSRPIPPFPPPDPKS